MIQNKFYYGIVREDGTNKKSGRFPMKETEFKSIINRYESKMCREVGRAFYMGKVEALLDEGYSITEIANKLGKTESVVRNYIKKINDKRSKK